MHTTDDAPALPGPRVEVTRWLAVGSVLALIAVGLVAELGVARSWWAIKVLPLCIPLGGLLKRRLYTYRWVSLMVWAYFTDGVVQAWVEHGAGRALAVAEVFLSLVLFAACVVHVRVRLKGGG